MANNERKQELPGGAAIIDRRRFLKQTALATAVVSVPYWPARPWLSGSRGKGADAALDRALEDLVAMRGGPPGVIAVVQRGAAEGTHRRGANIKIGRPIGVNDRMRIASTAKAFSGAVALSLVSKGTLSLNDTIGELLPELPKPPPAWSRSRSDNSSTTPAACRTSPRTPASGKRS